MIRLSCCSIIALVVICGCTARPATGPGRVTLNDGLSPPTPDPLVDAFVRPPLNWKLDPIKRSSSHVHEVWLSPDRRTAYGVISFSLPLPVGPDMALWGFLNQMRRDQGDARLLDKLWDPQNQTLHFVAEGGLYRIRANLFVDGFHGWVVYAGSLRSKAVNEADVDLAGLARDRTRVGGVGK